MIMYKQEKSMRSHLSQKDRFYCSYNTPSRFNSEIIELKLSSSSIQLRIK